VVLSSSKYFSVIYLSEQVPLLTVDLSPTTFPRPPCVFIWIQFLVFGF
jgi:hypothetical protein